MARDGLLWTVNDSGDEARVFTVDRSGRTAGVARWDADPVDVEALAPGPPGRVWVGDIGDNTATRGTVSVTSVPVGPDGASGGVRTYELDHPGGSVDAEALLADPRTGRLVVVTKGLVGGQVLVAPRELDADGANRLRPIGDTMALVTDGAFLPDGATWCSATTRGRSSTPTPGSRRSGRCRCPGSSRARASPSPTTAGCSSARRGCTRPCTPSTLPARVARAVEDRPAGAQQPSASASAGARAGVGPRPRSGAPGAVAVAGRDRLVLGAMVVVLLRALRPR